MTSLTYMPKPAGPPASNGDTGAPGEKLGSCAERAIAWTFGGSANRSIYARFRLSSTGGLGPDGPSPDGEVEDYLFSFGPNAVSVRDFRAAPAPSNDLLFALLLMGLALAGVAFVRRSHRAERPRQESRHE